MSGYTYIFSNSYKPILGGVQTVASQVAETLAKRGERVVVVTKVARQAFAPFSKICGVPVFRIHDGYGISFLFLYLLFFIKKPKVVFVHFPEGQSRFVLKLKKHFDFKLITCFHGHDVLRYNEGYSTNSETYKFQKMLIEESDNVCSCSNYLAGEVERIFGCTGVIPVYNGVDLSRYDKVTTFPVGYESPYLFAFGRLEKIKGYDMLINAFAELEEHDDLRLYIAGDGSQRDALQKQIEHLNLSDKVKLIGRKSPDEIVQLTQHADVIVIPSYRESFGIVVLEAIAAKRPVVATEAGGIPEIMDSRFGELVVPSALGIAEEIKKALTRQDYEFDDAKEYLGEFSIENMVDNYLKLIN